MSLRGIMGTMEAMHPETPAHALDRDSQANDPPAQLDVVARRRSIIGALGSLTSAHDRALEFAGYFRSSDPRAAKAYRSTAEGYAARIGALRAELVSLDVTDGRCHARCRDGHACRAPVVRGRRRCKLHGGLSTGPRTDEGRARALAALASVHARRRQQHPAEQGAGADLVAA